jgi:hypothetical protein
MYKFDRKIWNHRVRKTVILSLAVPLLNIMPQGPAAYAADACVLNTHYTRVSTAGASTVIYRFTNTAAECTFTLPAGLSTASILAVGGGGGGGGDNGAGGGGGQLRSNASQSLSGVSSIDILVGSGGVSGSWGGASGDGTSSIIKWNSSTQYEAKGGKGGGGFGAAGGAGGTGGSGGTIVTDGQAGGKGAGDCTYTNSSPYPLPASRGGAPAGTTPSNSITGSSVNYGGGGGGGSGFQTNNVGTAILGTAGGGTSGGRGSNYKLAVDGVTARDGASAGQDGTANTGGGGGGGSACNARGDMNLGYDGVSQRTAGGAGASGVVIISFARISQTITFGSISNRNVNAGTVTVAPTSSFGLTVALTSATTSVCTVSGFVITPIRAGTCTINANQSGTDNYAPATQVQQSFSITGDVIQYNGNTATSTRNIESTTTTFPGAANTLSSGKLAQGTIVSSGLLFNMNAADSSSVVGTTWFDANRNGTTATAFGSPIYNSAEGYFQLNGSNQYLNLGSTVLPASNTTAFTASVMFKADKPNLTDQAIMAKYVDGSTYNGNFIIRTADNAKIGGWRPSYSQLLTPKSFDEGNINFATVTYDGTNYALYLNGVLQQTVVTGSAGSTVTDLILGARGYGSTIQQYFQGRIYSAQGYSKALTPAEVLQNYNALLPNQIASKTNYTLGQWNTSSDGSGTQYESSNRRITAFQVQQKLGQPQMELR